MAINQASSGINFASLEGDLESVSAQPDKIIETKAKDNGRKKGNFLFMGLREGSLLWSDAKKARLRELLGIKVEDGGKLFSAVVHYAKPNFAEVVHAHVRFLVVLLKYSLVLVGEKPVDAQGLVQGGMRFLEVTHGK